MNEQDFVTLDYVAQQVGMKKTSLYYPMRVLGIKPQKFELNNRSHITRADMELLKEVKANPWRINELKQARQQRATLGCGVA